MSRLDIIETMLDIAEIMQHEFNAIDFGDAHGSEKSYWRDQWEQYARRLNDEHCDICHGAQVTRKQPNIGICKQ